ARSAFSAAPTQTPKPSTTPTARVMAKRKEAGIRDIYVRIVLGVESWTQNRAGVVPIQCGDRCSKTPTRRTSQSRESRHAGCSGFAHDARRTPQQLLQHDLEWPRAPDRQALSPVDAKLPARVHTLFAPDAPRDP